MGSGLREGLVWGLAFGGFDYAHPFGVHGSTSLTTDFAHHGLGNLYKLLTLCKAIHV